MGGGGVRRGNETTTWEGRDEWPESSVDTADGSLMARYGATAPRRQWTARRLLDGEGRRERGDDGPRAQRRWAAMDGAVAN